MKKIFVLMTALSMIFAGYSQTAEKYLAQGNVKYAAQDYKGAIADYTKVIELQPADSDAYYNRGLAKANAGMKSEACDDFWKAAQLGDKIAKKYYKLNCR